MGKTFRVLRIENFTHCNIFYGGWRSEARTRAFVFCRAHLCFFPSSIPTSKPFFPALFANPLIPRRPSLTSRLLLLLRLSAQKPSLLPVLKGEEVRGGFKSRQLKFCTSPTKTSTYNVPTSKPCAFPLQLQGFWSKLYAHFFRWAKKPNTMVEVFRSCPFFPFPQALITASHRSGLPQKAKKES